MAVGVWLFLGVGVGGKRLVEGTWYRVKDWKPKLETEIGNRNMSESYH